MNSNRILAVGLVVTLALCCLGVVLPLADQFGPPSPLKASGKIQVAIDYPEEELGTGLVFRVYCTTNLPLSLVPPTVQPANGSFEQGLDGWDPRGSLRVANQGSSSAHSVAFNSGNEQPSGVLTTIVATVPGAAYELRFDQGISDYVHGEQQLLVNTQGSNLVQETFTLVGDGTANLVWTNRLLRFTASSDWTRISFHDKSPVTDAVDLWLDNVEVRPQAPATDWKLIKTQPATNRLIELQVQPGSNFLVLTCSNLWGEQTFTRVVSTPPLPRADVKLTISRVAETNSTPF